MGLLNLFSKAQPAVLRLPSGTMSVDRNGCILATTVSSAFDQELLEAIGQQVLRLFREARKAQIPVSELNLQFASFQINAREMRGGVLVFLKPEQAFHLCP